MTGDDLPDWVERAARQVCGRLRRGSYYEEALQEARIAGWLARDRPFRTARARMRGAVIDSLRRYTNHRRRAQLRFHAVDPDALDRIRGSEERHVPDVVADRDLAEQITNAVDDRLRPAVEELKRGATLTGAATLAGICKNPTLLKRDIIRQFHRQFRGDVRPVGIESGEAVGQPRLSQHSEFAPLESARTSGGRTRGAP